jgi:hypothetical protein
MKNRFSESRMCPPRRAQGSVEDIRTQILARANITDEVTF